MQGLEFLEDGDIKLEDAAAGPSDRGVVLGSGDGEL